MNSSQNSPQNLIVKTFKKARSPELFEQAQAVRFSVFVEEQNVPLEHEIDATDDTATHFIVLDFKNDTEAVAIATGRMFPDAQKEKSARLGRMAVIDAYRGQGIGKILLKAILKKAEAEGYDEAICDAQTHAIPYYEKQGFIVEGEEFLDENIPHFLMRCPLSLIKA